jgi:methylenetetrahydromethanopterin dehydrogenase
LAVRVGFAKIGNIGSAPLIEFLLDERAERNDIEVWTIGSGSKMNAKQSKEIASKLINQKLDLIVLVTPNASLPSPMKFLEICRDSFIRTIVISDKPTKKIIKKIEGSKQGYIIVEADSMIGARREFLDPIEMALFNSDIIRVLSITGVYNVIFNEIDNVIKSLNKRKETVLPRIIVDKDKAIAASGLKNPYSIAKATAAFEIACKVADISFEGCFIVKDWKKYTSLVAAGHEMMTMAACLANEARDIEKSNDMVLRTPHDENGKILQKRGLLDKPF